MLRIILIIILLYFLWRMLKIIFRIMNRKRDLFDSTKERKYPFKDIEEAKFEDITGQKGNGEPEGEEPPKK
ncbi:MAG: hypothetical protein KKB77_01170 [Bacteroidetes bacterium]|nr:hypothetical protein [Bacteroidota bacterium]